MTSHRSDWFPGRVSRQFRDNWGRIFGGKTDDKEQVDAALKHFGQDGCCSGSCDCSNKGRE